MGLEHLIKEEEKRMKRLRFLVDLTEAILMQSSLSLQEAYTLVENTKRAVLALFPGKDNVFELIYAPRFKRIITERFTIPGSLSGRN